MGSFDDTLAVACKEGDLNKIKKLVLEDDYDVNSVSFRNKVGVYSLECGKIPLSLTWELEVFREIETKNVDLTKLP